MDPVTSSTAPAIFTAQTSAPIHPESLRTSTGADGMPTLSAAQPASSVPDVSRSTLGNALDDTAARGSTGTTGSSSSASGLNTGLNNNAESKSTAPSSGTTSSTSAQDSTPAVTGLRQRVNSIGSSVNNATSNLGAKANQATSNLGAQVNQATSKVSAQLNQATDHPAVKNAKGTALKQVDQLREMLGRSPLIVHLEQRTNVDRVVLVAVGIVAYILLIPLNLFNMGFFFTQLLTFVPPLLLSARVLDKPDDQKTKLLLSYFVVFGFVQFAESAFGRFLANHIPQYFTVKLAFLAYLIHPRTKGALKIHESVLRPLLTSTRKAAQQSTSTPPMSRPSASTQASPTFGRESQTSGYAQAQEQFQAKVQVQGSGSTQDQNPVPSGVGIGSQLSGNSAGHTHLPSGGGTHGVGLDI